MKRLDLIQTKHNIKVGKVCEYTEPNVIEDSLFYVEDKLVGFYIRNINKYSERLTRFLSIADAEFKSKNVPKSTMKRASGLHDSDSEVLQYSTILGSVAPRHHMRRPYATISSVHQNKTARPFIKSMMSTKTEAIEDTYATFDHDMLEKMTKKLIEDSKEDNKEDD